MKQPDWDCCECHLCCDSFFAVVTPDDKAEIKEYHAARAIEHYEYEDKDIYRLWHPCDKLQDDGKCSIYKDRPYVCREFPEHEAVPDVWQLFCELARRRS